MIFLGFFDVKSKNRSKIANFVAFPPSFGVKAGISKSGEKLGRDATKLVIFFGFFDMKSKNRSKIANFVAFPPSFSGSRT